MGLAATLVALVVTAGVINLLDDGRDEREAPERAGSSTPGPSATATAELDLSDLPVTRAPFCDVIDEEGVTRALDGPVTGTAHYGNGDEAEIAPGYTDVSHEFNCTFEGSDGAGARVWLFARPVEQREATALVRRARHLPGCTFPDPLAFGRPTLTSVCEDTSTAEGAVAGNAPVTARMQGLFGDSWLSCEVTAPETPARNVRSRAGSWCVEVVTALGARPRAEGGG